MQLSCIVVVVLYELYVVLMYVPNSLEHCSPRELRVTEST